MGFWRRSLGDWPRGTIVEIRNRCQCCRRFHLSRLYELGLLERIHVAFLMVFLH